MYNFRSTTLTGSKLDSELQRHGARTSGTTSRKQERLQRFIEAQDKRSQAHAALIVTIKNEHYKVTERGQARAQELRRSSRISSLLKEYLGY